MCQRNMRPVHFSHRYSQPDPCVLAPRTLDGGMEGKSMDSSSPFGHELTVSPWAQYLIPLGRPMEQWLLTGGNFALPPKGHSMS